MLSSALLSSNRRRLETSSNVNSGAISSSDYCLSQLLLYVLLAFQTEFVLLLTVNIIAPARSRRVQGRIIWGIWFQLRAIRKGLLHSQRQHQCTCESRIRRQRRNAEFRSVHPSRSFASISGCDLGAKSKSFAVSSCNHRTSHRTMRSPILPRKRWRESLQQWLPR